MSPDSPNPNFTVAKRAALSEHPQFVAAMRCSAAHKTNLFLREPAIHRFAIDKGSSLLGIFVTSLHCSTEGLTLSALKAMCAESKLCSPGRVVAFVAAMRKRRDILPANPASRSRTRALVLSERFVGFQKDRLHAEILATALVSPIAEEGLRAFTDETFFPTYMSVVMGLLRTYFQATIASAPVIEFFSDRHGGMLVLHDVMAQSENALQSQAVTISVSGMSKRFKISRAHILKLLRDAHAEGLVTWQPASRELTLSPVLVLSLKRYFGSIFMATIYCLSVVLPQLQQQATGRSERAAHEPLPEMLN